MNIVIEGTYVQTACALYSYVKYYMGTTNNIMIELWKGVVRMFDSNTSTIALWQHVEALVYLTQTWTTSSIDKYCNQLLFYL